MLLSFVDESGRYRHSDTCVYTLAAVVVEATDVDELRERLRALRYGKSRRLHWRDERDERDKRDERDLKSSEDSAA